MAKKRIYRKAARDDLERFFCSGDDFLRRVPVPVYTGSMVNVFVANFCLEWGADSHAKRLQQLADAVADEAERLDREGAPVVWCNAGVTSDNNAISAEIAERSSPGWSSTLLDRDWLHREVWVAADRKAHLEAIEEARIRALLAVSGDETGDSRGVELNSTE